MLEQDGRGRARAGPRGLVQSSREKAAGLRENEVTFLSLGKGDTRAAEVGVEEGCLGNPCAPESVLRALLGCDISGPAFQVCRASVLLRVLRGLL